MVRMKGARRVVKMNDLRRADLGQLAGVVRTNQFRHTFDRIVTSGARLRDDVRPKRTPG